VVDCLARVQGVLFGAAKSLGGFHGPGNFTCARASRGDALLVKPRTFMNQSGQAVLPLVRWAGIEAGAVLVVYDDLDLEPGRLRFRPFGGAGGHNGMRSIIDDLGTDRFPRLRVGIGRSSTDAARHVLSRFTEAEAEELAISAQEAAEALDSWLSSGDLADTMTRYHSRWKQGEG
jgi:PTH1 family peptidyl-tRNA hydrolase